MALTRNIFADNKLQAAIDSALEKVPADKKFAIVAHADLDGATITVVGRVDDHWTIEASCVKPWNGSLSAEADIVAAW